MGSPFKGTSDSRFTMKWFPSEYSNCIKIGEGTYSTVYRAYQKKLERNVILKKIKRSASRKLSDIAGEIHTLASLHLDCVPSIYDVSKAIQGVTIVMEWIEGIPLDTLYQQKLSPTARITIATEMIKSLAQLHAVGIAHRDLKPQNIIIKSDCSAILIDFGFSHSGEASSKNDVNHLSGTPAYMAPELWSAEKNIDILKADCYAHGLLLEKLIGNEFTDLLRMLLHADPAQRVANASVFKKLWDEQLITRTIDIYTSEISEIVQDYTAAILLDGTRQLLQKKRFNDAYEVFMELLEICPDNADALQLLKTHFSNPPAPVFSRNVVIYGSAAVIVLFALTGAFLLGRNLSEITSISTSLYDASRVDERIKFSLAAVNIGQFPEQSIAELRASPQQSAFQGEVTVRLPSGKGILLIDGTKVVPDVRTIFHGTIESGTHRFE
jgi:serine/threonine protein kinase